jgi:replicative DNA helicase
VDALMAQSLDDFRRRQPSTPAPGARLLPHNVEAEESLLGAMLLSREAIASAAEICNSDDFYRPAHGHIYESILSLYARGEPADPVTVADELRRSGLLDMIGGSGALVTLQAGTPTTTNAQHYARIVEEHALLRKLIAVAGDIAEMGYSLPEDIEAAVDRAEAMMFDVAQRRTSDTMAPLRDLLGLNLDRLEMLYERGESITGIPSGYLDLDERLNGLQPNALYIVGARPAMGKSAFALGMAAHAALDQHKPVLFFSLEMSHMELTQRLLCSEAKVDANRMRNGKLLADDWPKITNAVGRLAEAPIYIDDNPNLTIMEIRGKARRLKAKLGDLGLIVIDYLQLMTGRASAENRQVEVAEISRGLKILARELEVPVVALSQLSRSLEQRADKRPMLSDLRESGCMPASTKLRRADTGEEISLGELVLTQIQPMVWSLDSHQRMVPAKLTKAFPSGIKECFRLRLASGRSVEASANHPFLTIAGWKRLDELDKDNFVATPRRLPSPTTLNDTWTNDRLALLAHMLGDGSMGPSFKYATADPENRDLVCALAKSLFDIDATYTLAGRTFQVWFPSPYRLTHGVRHPMSNWADPLGLFGSRSWNKFVPSSIFGCSADQIAHFLHHLWATDGSITIGRNGKGDVLRTYYASTSEQLALDVQQLLLRLGIRSTIGSAKKQRTTGVGEYRPGFSVRVQGTVDQTNFLSKVGCFGARGAVIPEALAVAAKQVPNPNVDLVPWGVADAVCDALRSSGITHRALAEALGEDYCGSYLLGNEARPRRFSRGRLRRIGETVKSPHLIDVATSDVFWDRIVSIESTGMQPTFDATVEGTHNFIADGVVAHNSLEQDADVVMFLYRDEIYNPESPDRGTAEIIVAKHRSGPVGTSRLAFLDHYTKFANMAKGI